MAQVKNHSVPHSGNVIIHNPGAFESAAYVGQTHRRRPPPLESADSRNYVN